MCFDSHTLHSCGHVVRAKTWCKAMSALQRANSNLPIEKCARYERLNATSATKCNQWGEDYCFLPGKRRDTNGKWIADLSHEEKMARDTKEAAELRAAMEKRLENMTIVEKTLGPIEPLVLEKRFIVKKPHAWEQSTASEDVATQEKTEVQDVVTHTESLVLKDRIIDEESMASEQSPTGKSAAVHPRTEPRKVITTTKTHTSEDRHMSEKPMAWVKSSLAKSSDIQRNPTTHERISQAAPLALEGRPINEKPMAWMRSTTAKNTVSTKKTEAEDAMDWTSLGIKKPIVVSHKPAARQERKSMKDLLELQPGESNEQALVPIVKKEKNTGEEKLKDDEREDVNDKKPKEDPQANLKKSRWAH